MHWLKLIFWHRWLLHLALLGVWGWWGREAMEYVWKQLLAMAHRSGWVR